METCTETFPLARCAMLMKEFANFDGDENDELYDLFVTN